MTHNFDRRALLASLLGLPVLGACKTLDSNVLNDVLGGVSGLGGLTQAEAAHGIRVALNNGVGSAINTVGVLGGYLNDGRIHIALPSDLQNIQGVLQKLGAGKILDSLETALNHGAETAAPMARELFVDVISKVTITDAIAIVQGPENAATSYLSERSLPSLTRVFNPIMTQALESTGALQLFDQLTSSLTNVPFAPQLGAKAKTQLIEHGVSKGLGGLFYYIGEQEAAIRSNPAERTSEILRRVFGSAY